MYPCLSAKKIPIDGVANCYAVFYFTKAEIMKITKTMKTEKFIVELYKKSRLKNEEGMKAQKKIKAILLFFQFISVFTDEDHLTIVQKLYFSKENIVNSGVQATATALYIPERTLLYYRRKYCIVIEMIIAWVEENS